MSSNINYDFILERIHFPGTIVLDEPGKTYTCGRGKENQILCLSLMVSRQHCSFFHNNHEIYVIDLGSSNGIFVNEVKQKARHMVKLKDNDTIGIGCPDSKNDNSDMFIYKLRFVIKKESTIEENLTELPKSSIRGNTLIKRNSKPCSSLLKRKGEDDLTYLGSARKISKLSKDTDISCQVEVSDKKLNNIDNQINSNQEIEVIDTFIKGNQAKLNKSSSDTHCNNSYQKCNDISIHENLVEENDKKEVIKQEKLSNITSELKYIRENEVIFIDPPKVLDTEILQHNYDDNSIEICTLENEKQQNYHDNNFANIKESNDISTRTSIGNVINALPKRHNYEEDKKICDEKHNSTLKCEVSLKKKKKLNESENVSKNIIHNGDYFIKMEDELIISENDDEEKAAKNNMKDCNSYIISPIKLKQIKQEPKSRFSELDIVNLSDDEEDVFPCSQLFDSGLDINSEVKEKIKQGNNDNHDEDNRLDDTEVIISLSDSEDEENVWLHRLSRSQLLNDTVSNNDKTSHIVKDEPMDIIDNDLKNIIKESENVNNVSYKCDVNNEITKVTTCKDNTHALQNIKINMITEEVTNISSHGEKMEVDLTSSPVNIEQGKMNKKSLSPNEKSNMINNDIMPENIPNSTTHSKEMRIANKRSPQIIDPPHMSRSRTRKGKSQSKDSNITRDKITPEKKKTSDEQKIEEYIHFKNKKQRRVIHAWANCLPPSKGKRNSLSKEEKKELVENRKTKLKKIATEEKKITTTENNTLKRTTTKVKAKVSLKSRGDFLINETQSKANVSRAMITESKEKNQLKNNSVDVITKQSNNVELPSSDLQIKIKKSDYKEILNNITEHLGQSLTVGDIKSSLIKIVDEINTNINGHKNIENLEKSSKAKENESTEIVTTNSTKDEIKTIKHLKLQKENCSPNRQASNKLEKKRKTVSFNNAPEIREYQIDSQNTLRKLKGKDAPIPVDKLSFKKSNKTNCPKIEDFLLRIFCWNPVWLEEQKYFQQMPPIVKENEMHPMLTFYKSYSDYYKIAEPLLLLEIWYGITKEFEMIEKNTKRPTMMCSILEHSITHTHVPSVNLYSSTLTVEVLVTKENLSKQIHPNYGDLVFFEYVKNENGKYIFHKIFAYVTNMYLTTITPFTEYNKDLENYVKKPHALLTYKLLTKKLEDNLVINRVQRIRTVTYLRANMRMIQAIQYLPQSPLMDLILQPKVEAYQLPQVEVQTYQLITKDKLNQKQLEAVTKVTEAVIQEKAKVCCIQGPPGTGKSKVIVNIITEILYGNNRYEKNKGALRILVCAPSNAAIDEIVLRLLAIRATIKHKEKRFKMVRIGKPETMHQTVRDISLSELGKRDVKRVRESYSSKSIPIDSVEEEKLFLEARINALKCEILNSQKIDETYKKYLKMKLSDLNTKYELLQNHKSMNEMSTSEFAKLQRLAERRILEGADIISCTLSSCYTNQMETIFGGSNKKISVCIVDEATQCCEAENLIPLLLGVNTLVLVGDPNQLPATVISQQAKRLGLDQSLFARVQNAFQGEKNNPIIMLNTQYRMALPISYWPNKYFYGCKLKNAVKNITTFPFQNYRVLNLTANQNNDKFSNTNEAEAIANIILCMITDSNLERWESNISIGILTPYKNQRFLISKIIDEKLSNMSSELEEKRNRFSIEINTVDSFQGQERDVILMSCVRSHGIGFLSDRQRLCVALTRAKHTLILCGNFYAFMRDQMWNALISDAKSRGIYQNININAKMNEIKPYIIK